MFLKLHYKSNGRQFLISTLAIDGVEINGTEKSGCVITLSTEIKGERAHEEVRETFSEIERLLWNAGLMANS